MGLFGKKKKSNQLRNLTERDIQKKLYGNIQSDLPPSSKSPHSEVSFHQDRATAVSAPDTPASRDDLFEQVPPSLPEKERKKQPEAPVKPRVEKPEPAVKSPAKTGDPWQKPPRTQSPQAGLLLEKVRTLAVKLLRGTGLVIKAVAGVIAFVFIVCFKVIQLIDLRRPKVRRVLYWLAGFAILISLFLGIHLLNVKREAAMRPSPAAAPAADTPAPREPARPSRETPAVREPVREETPPSVAEPRREERPAAPQQPAAQEETNPYVIQIATYVTQEDAERVAQSLRAEDLPAFTRELSRPSGRVYYSVFLGRFPTFRQTQVEFERFRQKEALQPFADAFIRTLD